MSSTEGEKPSTPAIPDQKPVSNGSATDRGWSKRIIQPIALVTGILLLIADYGLGLLTEDHLPVVIYCLAFGVAWGLDPALWVGMFTGGKK